MHLETLGDDSGRLPYSTIASTSLTRFWNSQKGASLAEIPAEGPIRHRVNQHTLGPDDSVVRKDTLRDVRVLHT